MLYEFLCFVNQYKLTFLKVFSVVSFALIFIKPMVGFSVFFISIIALAYLDKFVELFNKKKQP